MVLAGEVLVLAGVCVGHGGDCPTVKSGPEWGCCLFFLGLRGNSQSRQNPAWLNPETELRESFITEMHH